MSDSGNKTGISKPLIVVIESEKDHSFEHSDPEEKGEEKVEKEENVALIDLSPETTKTSDSLEGGPQRRERKLTEKGKAYEIEKLCQKRQNAYTALSKQMNRIRRSLDNVDSPIDLVALEADRDELD